MSTKNLISGVLKARNSCISVWPKHFHIWTHCKVRSNLTQEIQFLEFMGGSNLTHAHSSDLICMNTVSKHMKKKGIAESMHAYITRARLRERWAYFWEKYHNSPNIPTPRTYLSSLPIAYFWEITVLFSHVTAYSGCITILQKEKLNLLEGTLLMHGWNTLATG